MTRIIAIVLLIIMTLSCTYSLRHYNEYTESEPIVVSDRVGEVLDAEEREQFGLLKGIEDFEAAQYFSGAGGGYDVVIHTKSTKLIACNREPDAIEILRDYLDRYEAVCESIKIFEQKWDIVDYDDLGQPITKNEVNMSIRRIWQRYLPGIGATAGCIGSCLIFGTPEIVWDAPSDYESDEDYELYVALYSCSCLAGYVSGWVVGDNLDERIALSKIKEVRKPKPYDTR